VLAVAQSPPLCSRKGAHQPREPPDDCLPRVLMMRDRDKLHAGLRRSHGSLLVALLWAALGSPAAGQTPTPLPPDHAERMAKGTEFFKKHVRQLLTERCLKCHGGEKTRADFDLSTREGLLKGGDGGTAVIPCEPKKSRLLRLVAHLEEP